MKSVAKKKFFPKISFIKPYWGKKEFLCGSLYRDTGNNNSVETLVKRFKKKLNIKGTIIPTSSGRTALELALRVLKNKYPDKNKVIIPVYGCKGTFYPVIKTGLKPVLIDIGKDLNITVDTVRSYIKEDVLAILVVHLGGCRTEIEEISQLAEEKGIIVIEDVCQGLGGKTGNTFWGTQYDMTIFSAGMGKNLMATAGGFLVSNILEKEILEESKKLGNESTQTLKNRFNSIQSKCFSRKSADFDNCSIMNSYNYNKMHPLDAKLLYIQLSKLDSIVRKRQQNAERVIRELNKTGLKFHLQDNKNNVYTKFSIIFDDTNECSRLKSSFHKVGIETEEMYIPLRSSVSENPCPYAEKVYKNIFNIPVRPNLKKKELGMILRTISNFK